MPTDTQREPSALERRIEAERRTHLDADQWCHCARCKAARAATDEAVKAVEADAARWRAFAAGAVVTTDEDGGLCVVATLADDWEGETYLTSTYRKILRGDDMRRWCLRGKIALDRIIDAACEIGHQVNGRRER